MSRMTRTERELLRLLQQAHHNLDKSDLARGITRYPKPFNLEETNGNAQPERPARRNTRPARTA